MPDVKIENIDLQLISERSIDKEQNDYLLFNKND